MTIPAHSIKACIQCGCVYTENSIKNPARCPICKSMLGDNISGIS